MGDQGEVGWACMYVETQGGLCSSRTAGCERMGDKSQQDGGLACMSRRMRCLSGAAGCARMGDKSQQDGGLAWMSRRMRCLSGAGGCARMGDHGEAGWGLAYGYPFARLLDVNTQVITARRDGGLPVCRDASEIALWTC